MRVFILLILIKKNLYFLFLNYKGDEIKFKYWVVGLNLNLGFDVREFVIFKKKQIRFIENIGVFLKNDLYNVYKIYLKFLLKIGMIIFFVNFIKIKYNK